MRLPNLLSREHKNDYKFYLASLYARRFLVVQIIVSLVLGAAFVYQYFSLQDQKEILETSLTGLNEAREQIKVEDLQAKADRQTDRLKTASKVFNIRPELSVYLDELVEVLPGGVTLDIVDINTETKQMVVNGRAADREQVVVLQDRLEDSEYISIIYAPLSNLTEAQDASFEFILRLE